MHHVRTQVPQLRRAAFSLAVLASFGCGDNNLTAPPIAPAVAAPLAATIAPAVVPMSTSSSANAAPPNTSHGLPVLVIAASESAQPIVVTAAATRSMLTTPRYAREQVLGFQNDSPTKQCLGEGEALGAWNLRFSGYGCTQITTDDNGASLSMQPAAATGVTETHAPLLLGPEYGDKMTITARVETVQQLRSNGEPNAWEVAWVLWQYQDDQHFYYFIPKPNGWEIGKRDPGYSGSQRFLATGTDQKFPVGHAYNVQIAHRGNAFTVTVDGVILATVVDTERPYVSGRVALYSEDAEIKVHQVIVRNGAL